MTIRARPEWLPWTVIGCGVVYSLVLLSFVRGEVFYSGDGGLKALLVKQIASGECTLDLRLQAPPYLRTLWEAGLYPFAPPFVYSSGGTHHISFPVLFPLFSAPLYRLAGFRGLYVIPVVSLWAIWIMVDRLSRRHGASSRTRAWRLAMLVFGSPLSLYGAMFREHTLAVALAIAGFYMAGSAGSSRRVAAAGFVLGMSTWIRPELLAVLAGAALPMIGAWARYRPEAGRWWMTGILLAVGGFLVVNTTMSGHAFGFHGLQITHWFSATAHGASSIKLLLKLPFLFLCFFPPCIAIIAPRLRSLLAWRTMDSVQQRLFVGIVLGMIVLLVIIPNDGGKQWGPRYMLVLVPLLVLWSTETMRRGGSGGAETSLWPSRLAVGCLMAGVMINTGAGTILLAQDYRTRVLPALQYMEHDPNKVVAVSHQFVAQELEALFTSRHIVLTDGPIALHRLVQALDAQGIERFTYVCLANRVMPDEPLVTTARGERRIVPAPPVKKGWFLIYDVWIRY